MTTWSIVVADGSRARLLTAELPKQGSSVRLEEAEALVSPERNLRARDTFSNLKTGRNRASPRFAAHGYDDHRDRHRDQIERRFASRIAAAAAKLVRRKPTSPLVIVAEPRLLGMLRPELAEKLPESVPRLEIAEDLSWHALPRILKVLERRSVLPKSQPSPAAWRPRAQPPPERAARAEQPLRRTPRNTSRPRRARTRSR